MKDDYNIRVITNKDLGDPDFIKNLLEAWHSEVDSNLKPEFFGLGEPVRHNFAEKGIEAAIKMWITEGMGLLLRRRGSSFGYLATIDWWRRDKTLDKRLFPWSCNIYLRRKAGDEVAYEFFKFLIKWFDPAFGYLSTNEQIDEKHFITFEDVTGQTEQYEGLDLGKTLPGLYWITYFGPWAITRIGEDRFQNLEAEKIERVCEGNLVVAYPSSKEIGNPVASDIEKRIVNKLGRRYFFDKSKIDIESLKDESEEAEIIEKKVEEAKLKKLKKP